MFPVALAILVLHSGGGAGRLGLILAIQTVALVVGTFAAAAFGDRWRRTRVMMATDIVRAAAVITIAVGGTHQSLAVLEIMVALVGLGEGIFQPVFSAAIPRLLPKDLLQPANGLNSLSMYMSMVLGPGLAGAVLGAWGPPGALWIDAVTFVASMVTLVAVREVAMETGERRQANGIKDVLRHTWDDMREGFRAVRYRPWLGVTITMSMLIMLLVSAPSLLLLPVEAVSRLGGAHSYSLVLVAMGIGSTIGAIVSGRIHVRRPGLVALCGVATIAVSDLGLAFLPLPGVIVTWCVSGFGVTLFNTLWVTAIQKNVPDAVMARVMALDWMGSMALMPLGYGLTGAVSHVVGVRPILIAGAILVLIMAPVPLLIRGGSTFTDQPGAEPDLPPTR